MVTILQHIRAGVKMMALRGYISLFTTFLMGLHFVQVPEYLYWVIVHSIRW